MILLASAAALSLAFQAEAADTSALDAAQAYMAAYSALDLEAMRAWLNEDTVFTDETYVQGEETGPHTLNGEDALIALLEGFIDEYHPLGLNFEWDQVFESNDRVVFSGWVNARYPTEIEGELFQWRSPQVTILTMQDGQVIHHRDFVNWETPDERMVAAQ